MKTSELIGPALDWAVAKCEGLEAIPNQPKGFFYWESPEGSVSGKWCPSTDWSQGGPLIERECLDLQPDPDIHDNGRWVSYKVGHRPPINQYGPTPLISAMRCFVASKLGNEVEIPEELQ